MAEPASDTRADDAAGARGEEPQALPSGGGGGEGTPASSPSAGGTLLRGATVAPGLVLGRVHRKDYDLAQAGAERVPLDELDRELNRFRKALDDSRAQLRDLKSRLQGRVAEDDARILDTHLAYLKDSVFIADVENLILNEQMRLETAIGKVVGDFDRIFRLVQNDTLRQSAVDLRDVGIRVLRNLEQGRILAREAGQSDDYVLVARELSIVDMFNLANEHVRGIVTREGGLTSHAAIFARSMRIPTLTGVEGVLDVVKEGDFVILDATEGLLRVNPDEVVRAQYAETQSAQRAAADSLEVPDWARRPARTRDGEQLMLSASCGNLPEVEQATRLGMRAVGLYRTELLYLVDKLQPSRDTLVRHYASVIAASQAAPVTFRLLNVDSALGVGYLHDRAEKNPSLGRAGIRALLANENVLRRQLQAFLLAARDTEARLVVPFVTDCGELRRVREVLFEERLELKKTGDAPQASTQVGVVVETPAAMLGVRDLAREADFLMLNLDSLQQYLLATDRENAELADTFDLLHPYVLRALQKVTDVARTEGRPLIAFGVSATKPANLPLLLGVGLRDICVPPTALRELLDTVERVDAQRARVAAASAARSACPAEVQSFVESFRHGYARPGRNPEA